MSDFFEAASAYLRREGLMWPGDGQGGVYSLDTLEQVLGLRGAFGAVADALDTLKAGGLETIDLTAFAGRNPSLETIGAYLMGLANKPALAA